MLKSYDIEKEIDLIDDDMNIDIKLRTNRFQRWFISNIFGRAFSYLVGWTGTTCKFLKCTSGGVLRVSIEGGAYETNTLFEGTAGENWTVARILPDGTSKVEIWTKDADILFKRSNNNYTYDDEILLEQNSYYVFEAASIQFAVKRNAGINATYRLQAWS